MSSTDFIDRWLEKANQHDNGTLEGTFDRFLTLYIVYNALYVKVGEKLYPNHKERKKIMEWQAATENILKYLDEEEVKKAFDIANSQNQALDRFIDSLFEFKVHLNKTTGEWNLKQELDFWEDLSSSNSERKAKAILKGIYQIRNNTFHGRKAFSPNQERLLEPASTVLNNIVKITYRKLKGQSDIW